MAKVPVPPSALSIALAKALWSANVPWLLITALPPMRMLPPPLLVLPLQVVLPARFRVRPPLMSCVRLPLMVSPPAVVVTPPPVMVPPLQVEAPVAVIVPLPPSVPALKVSVAVVTGALAVKVPPDTTIAFAVIGPPIVSVPLLTLRVLLTCDRLLPKVRLPPLTCNSSRLDTAAAACDPTFTVMVWAPTRSGINTAWLAIGVPRLQLPEVFQSPPAALIQVLITNAPVTLSVALLAP